MEWAQILLECLGITIQIPSAIKDLKNLIKDHSRKKEKDEEILDIFLTLSLLAGKLDIWKSGHELFFSLNNGLGSYFKYTIHREDGGIGISASDAKKKWEENNIVSERILPDIDTAILAYFRVVYGSLDKVGLKKLEQKQKDSDHLLHHIEQPIHSNVARIRGNERGLFENLIEYYHTIITLKIAIGLTAAPPRSGKDIHDLSYVLNQNCVSVVSSCDKLILDFIVIYKYLIGKIS